MAVSPDDDQLLTIGQLADQTGVSPQLIRTWETRFGFPEPVRLPSGHRRYRETAVHGVRRVVDGRARGLKVEQAVEAARRAQQATTTGSVYAALSARHADLAAATLTKRTLLALSWALEDEAAARAARGVLVGAFQRGRYYGQSRRRWEDLARTAAAAVVLADFDTHDDASRPARVALPADSPLLREWIVVHDAPEFAAVLVAYELPQHAVVPEAERRFEAVWSLEGPIVRDAACVALEGAVDLGSSAAGHALAHVNDSEAAPPLAPRAANALFQRMMSYVDGATTRGR